MFAKNERISLRQFHRLLMLELFGVTTVLLPRVLCERVRQDGITALFLGLFFVFLYGWFLNSVAKRSGRSLQQTLKEQNLLYYEIFLFVMLVQMILMGNWVLSLAAELSRDILLKESELRFVIPSFAAICFLGAWKGMECRGRMAEVLYLFLLVPFLILLVLAAGKMETDSIEPLFIQPAKTVLSGGYEVFIIFQGVTLGFFALPYLKKQEYFWQGVRKSILLNGMFCLILLIVAIGIFGLNGAAKQKWLAVNLMTTPDLPGGFAERMDVLMVTIWIVSLFFFISGAFFYSGRMAGRLLRMKREKNGLLLTALLITVGSLLCDSRTFSYNIYLNYMKYIGVPLLFLILLLVKWRIRPKQAAAVITVLFLAVGGTVGCAKGVELEDREFALALGVDVTGEHVEYIYDTSQMNAGNEESAGEQKVVKVETGQMSDLLSAYGQQSDKYLDCNHLKALIIGKNLATNQEKLIEFLQYVQKQEMFASNVKVFLAKEDLDSIFSAAENTGSVLGEYLENLYIDSNYYVEGQSCSLGSLLRHWQDYDETLLVPVLEAKDAKLLIGSYGVMRQVQWTDTMDPQLAELVFLANGVNVRMELQADNSCSVNVEHVSRDIAFADKKALEAVLTLHLRGQVLNREMNGEKEKRELEQKLEQKLADRYQEVVSQWKGCDVFHLFRALGKHDREMWLKYRKDRKQFDESIQVTVQVEMQIM